MKQKSVAALPKGLFEPDLNVFSVMSAPQTYSYKVNIFDDFVHPEQFQEIVDILDQANEGDFMCMNVGSGGGAIHAVLPLLGAMKHTSAHIHVNVSSDSASATTLIIMAADSVSVNDYVTIMFHQVSFGSFGAGNRVEAEVNHVMKNSKTLLQDSYKHFFSDSDMQRMLHGHEFYMTKDDFLIRYEARQNLIDQEMEQTLEKAIAQKEAEENKLAKPAVKKPLKLSSKSKLPAITDVNTEN